jgi:cobalt-zinc-cadmium efflux system membrane fusion protein
MIKNLFIINPILVVSCKQLEVNEAVSNEDEITILTSQFNASEMQIGQVQPYEFEKYVETSGQTFVPNQFISSLSAQLSGHVKNIYCEVGDYVIKGQTLMTLSSQELLDIEREYALQINQTKYLKAEYERQKTLFSEKISSEKEFYKAESDYKTNVAIFKNLEKKLEIIKRSSLNVKNNDFSVTFSVVANISGYVTNINTNIGSFVNNNDHLIDIIDVSKVQVKLKIFSQDFAFVKIGQKVQFLGLNTTSESTILKINKIIDQTDQSIEVFTSFKPNENQVIAANMFIRAKIILGKTTTKSLPNDAILTEGKINYALKLINSNKNELIFKRIPIKVGVKDESYTEIIGEFKNDKFLIKGVSEFY